MCTAAAVVRSIGIILRLVLDLKHVPLPTRRVLDVDVDDPYTGRASMVAIAKAIGVTTPLVSYDQVYIYMGGISENDKRVGKGNRNLGGVLGKHR